MRKVRTPHRPQKFKSYRNVGFFILTISSAGSEHPDSIGRVGVRTPFRNSEQAIAHQIKSYRNVGFFVLYPFVYSLYKLYQNVTNI